MPGPEYRDRYQYACLWEKNGVNTYGVATHDDPIEIRVRWNDTKSENRDPQSENQAFDAQVVVFRDIEIDSLMWLGRLSALGTDLTPAADWMQVVKVTGAKDIKGRNQQRGVFLMRYRR